MNKRIIAILAPFLSRHRYCDALTVEACSLSLEKMSKSSEKVKKKYADAYKWTDDEVELLLTVTKEYKTKQIAKHIDWESCVDKYGEILEAYSAHYALP